MKIQEAFRPKPHTMKSRLESAGIKQWQAANYLGISPGALCSALNCKAKLWPSWERGLENLLEEIQSKQPESCEPEPNPETLRCN